MNQKTYLSIHFLCPKVKKTTTLSVRQVKQQLVVRLHLHRIIKGKQTNIDKCGIFKHQFQTVIKKESNNNAKNDQKIDSIYLITPHLRL